MKKNSNFKTSTFVLAWVVIYLLTLAFGSGMACFISWYGNKNLVNLTQSDAEYYADNGSFPLKTQIYQLSAYVYDLDGELLDSYITRGVEVDVNDRAGALIEQVRSSGSVYHILFSANLQSWIGVLVAVPLISGGGTESVYISVKGLHSLQTVLIVLFSTLTVMFVLSCVYSILILRNGRKMEQLRRKYIANVSHNLKSPIASIKALSESLSDGVIEDGEKREKCIRLILSEANELEHTVGEILELSKTQTMPSAFPKSAISAAELFAPVIEKYSVLCDKHGIDFTAPGNLAELPLLYTNANRIALLADILLDNAVKFVPQGGHIRLEAERGRRQLTMCVRDNGAGISPADQKHIFERFYQGAPARKGKGGGLGLAIASEIADCLNEKLWVESSLGHGAAFFFTLGYR